MGRLTLITPTVYVAWGFTEWDICGTGKDEVFENFWLYSWRMNWGVITDVFYYHFYGFVNLNDSKMEFDIEWCRYVFVGGVELKICMISWVDLILYLFGIHGTIILLRIFYIWYTEVRICEMIGLGYFIRRFLFYHICIRVCNLQLFLLV